MAHLKLVIESAETVGAGTREDPTRIVVRYFEPVSGALLAEATWNDQASHRSAPEQTPGADAGG